MDAETVERDEAGGRWRRCAVLGSVVPEAGLIRFVVSPDGLVTPDLAAELPGRGTWVCAQAAILDKAAARGAFARSQKRGVSVPPGLSALVAALLEARCLAALGLARKSGALLTGFEKVQDASRTGKACALIEAADAAEDGRAKVLALAAKAVPGVAVIGAFRIRQLSLALGLENVVHAVLTNGRHADRLVRDVRRLGGFRPVLPEHWTIPGAVTGVADPFGASAD